MLINNIDILFPNQNYYKCFSLRPTTLTVTVCQEYMMSLNGYFWLGFFEICAYTPARAESFEGFTGAGGSPFNMDFKVAHIDVWPS